ncbi:uncharacterized protein METZ01_LOCUS483037, partial [marine metagenome]
QLELELGKVYKGRGNFDLSKEIFSMIVEKYSKKNETAEAYYQLGFISLMEDFNIDRAREYFESSKSEKSSSFYGKESKDLLVKITHYETLMDLYNEAINNPDDTIKIDKEESSEKGDTSISDMNENDIQDENRNFRGGVDFDIGAKLENMDFASQKEEIDSHPIGMSPDSILFMIGEMLLYDFNYLERSLEKLKTLVLNYPESKFASQSLYILSHYEPDADWHRQLETKYPSSAFLNPDFV